MSEKEPYKWITVKGKHIPVYKNEYGEDVFGVGSEQKEKSPADMNEDEIRNYIQNELMDKDSYFNTPEYQDLMKYTHTAFETQEKLQKQWLETSKAADKEIDQDSYKELVEMFDGDKSLAKALANKTPKGQELQKQADELHEKFEEARKVYETASSKLDSIKRQQAKSQYVDFQNTPDYKDAGKESEYKGFQFNTGVTHYEDLKTNSDTRIVEMTPKQYLQECAYNIFDSTYEHQLLVGMADAKQIKNLLGLMQSGTEMYLPYLNYKESQQEGRHRAMAAMLLGIDKIPVMIVGKKGH